MQFKKKTIAILVGIVLLSGCDYRNIPNVEQSDNAISQEISDPMQEPTESSNTSTFSISYGYSFTEDRVAISENKLLVSPTLKGGDSPTRVGIMLFIDGVLQEYSVQGSSNKTSMSVFDIEAGSEVMHELEVAPQIDGTFDDHLISMITMLYPEFVPPSDTPRFGFYHKILRPLSVIAPTEIQTVSTKESYKILAAKNSVLTQKQREKFSLDDTTDSQGYVTQFYLQQRDDLLETNYVLADGDDSLLLNFCAFTTNSIITNYRVTFFVNHKPVKFNNDYEYLDITLEGDKITEVGIELTDIKVGDIVYCIAVPLAESAQCEKSESRMVLNSNSSGENNLTQEIPTTDFEGAKTIISNERFTPQFSLGEFVYSNNGGVVSKINSMGEIENKLDGAVFKSVHGDKISVVGGLEYIEDRSGTLSWGEKQNTTLMIYDNNLNKLKSLEIDENIGNIYDFNQSKIVFIHRNVDGSEELRICDWDFKNQVTLMALSSDSDGRFNEVSLTDEFVAFTLTDVGGNYYGVCDFNGNFEKHSKSGMSSEIQIIGNTALWLDKHVDVIHGEISSGEVILYRNGGFETIQTENSLESQFAFLTSDDEFFTILSEENILRRYKNGVLTTDIPLENDEYVFSVVRAENKVFASTRVGNDYKLKIWELN